MYNQPQPRPDTRNLILAVVLAMAIMFGWQHYMGVKPPAPVATAAGNVQAVPQARTDNSVAAAAKKLAPAPRIKIRSGNLHGSISLRGGRIDDLRLANYRETLAKDSPEVRLLAASDAKQSDPYFAEFGVLAGDESIKIPGPDTLWQADRTLLTPSDPVTLRFDNGRGLVFIKRISLDANYMFTAKLSVQNNSGSEVEFYPYGLILRSTADDQEHYAILHEGPLGVFGQELKQYSYKDLREDGDTNNSAARGWVGITDKYWLTALIPVAGHIDTSFRHVLRDGRDAYQVDLRGESMAVAPGVTSSSSMRFYAGAKEVALLDRYSNLLGIPLLDRAVDFGRLYFLTKPIFHVLSWFHGIVGNFGIAILLLTVCIKLLMYPLANKSFVSMHRIKELAPKMKELQERYKGDKMQLNKEIMALYQREKVNPASGCLPIILQIPVFFALYKVLFVTIEMRHSPFFGWINDLSAPDPTSIFNLFGLLPYEVPNFLLIGVWPCIMCATMVLQQRLNPSPSDPLQANLIKWMPFVFLFVFASFPAGLVVYWAWNNTLSVAQQALIKYRLERQPVKSKKHKSKR